MGCLFWFCGCPRLSPMGCSVPLCKCLTASSPPAVVGVCRVGCTWHPLPGTPSAALITHTMGKRDSGCKSLLLALLLKRSSLVCCFCFWVFFFLMKPHMFPVSLGTSLSTSDFCPGNKSPIFVPDSSAEGRGQDLKTKPKPNSPNAAALTICSRRCSRGRQGAGPVLPHGARSHAAGPAPAALQEDKSHKMLQNLFGWTWK